MYLNNVVSLNSTAFVQGYEVDFMWISLLTVINIQILTIKCECNFKTCSLSVTSEIP